MQRLIVVLVIGIFRGITAERFRFHRATRTVPVGQVTAGGVVIRLVGEFAVLAIEGVGFPILPQAQKLRIGFKQLAGHGIGGLAINVLLLHGRCDTGQRFGDGKTDTQFDFHFLGIGLDDRVDQLGGFFDGGAISDIGDGAQQQRHDDDGPDQGRPEQLEVQRAIRHGHSQVRDSSTSTERPTV
ncbi:hypothetical protein D3C84_934460 [compost metagenome]